MRSVFPSVGEDVVGALHARRAGWVSAQQYGTTLVQQARAAGVEFLSGEVVGLDVEDVRCRAGCQLLPLCASNAKLTGCGLAVVQGCVTGVHWTEGLAEGDTLNGGNGQVQTIKTGTFVNAAGPCLNQVHRMLPGDDGMDPAVLDACAEGGVARPADATPRWLPLRNHLHAKVIFRDTQGAVPRDSPMMIYADDQKIWHEADEDEREWLTEALGEPSAAKLLGTASPGVHLRPYAHDSLLLLWECVVVLCCA